MTPELIATFFASVAVVGAAAFAVGRKTKVVEAVQAALPEAKRDALDAVDEAREASKQAFDDLCEREEADVARLDVADATERAERIADIAAQDLARHGLRNELTPILTNIQARLETISDRQAENQGQTMRGLIEVRDHVDRKIDAVRAEFRADTNLKGRS